MLVIYTYRNITVLYTLRIFDEFYHLSDLKMWVKITGIYSNSE